MIKRLFYANMKLGTHQKSGDNVEVEGVRVGHCTDRLKDKSKEKTCIKGRKQTVRRTNRQEKQSLKWDTQKSFTSQCFRESQCKQIRNSFISSFPKMGSTEIITQFEKRRDGLACFKERIQICCHSEWASVCGYCGMRSLYARKQPSATLFLCVLYFNVVTRTCPLAFEMQPEVLGSFGKALDKIPPNVVDFGWMEKSTRCTLSTSWPCPSTVP